MKKINYLVLMAAMMLIGTNAWAATITLGNKSLDASATYDHLGDAFKNAKDGDIIKLVTNLDDANQSWFGEKSATGSSRSITLDLNGKTFTYTGSKGVAIPVTRGKLEITSTSGVGTMTTAVKTDLIRVYGTYQKIDAKNSTPFAHLVVKENVQLVCTNDGANAVTVDVMRNDATQRGAMGVSAAKDYPLDYACNFYQMISGSGHGVANGVRLDIYGTLISKKYAIKVNGCIRLGKEFLDGAGNPITTKSGKAVANPYYDSIKSPLTYYEPKRSGGSYTITENDGDYSPYVFIASSARLVTNNYESTSSIAAYSSGYARWQIEGYCEGSTGVYVKSGEVVLNNAEVKSNYTGEYVAAATDHASGVDAAGSGIVMESSANYSGNIDVTVQGDTKVEGSTGYAIDEVVTAAADETKVDALTITGGTFGTGAEGQGAIKVTETTAIAAVDPEQTTTITISGGSIEEVDSEDNKIGDQTLADYLSDSEDTHVTIVENSDGSTTLVVSEGAEESVNYTTIKGHEDGASVNWKRTGGSTASMSETIDENVNLSELVINQAKYDQTVTIADGYTLSVGRVILGGRAKIVVKAGGKFIVTGNQGIVSSSTDNIVLETEAGKPSIFLFNPAVSSNRHPHATVQYKSTIAYRENSSNYQWERFGLPTWKTVESISCDNPTLVTNIQIYSTSGTWENLGNLTGSTFANISKLNKPFVSCNLLPNNLSSTPAGATYTFTGELTGNMDATLNVFATWTAFANSYSAYVDGAEMVAGISGATNVGHAIYMGAPIGNGKYSWFPYDAEWIGSRTLAPMQAFMLYNTGNVAEDVKINYKNSVYDPAVSGGAGAPRRAISNNTAKMRIVVENAQGEWDEVKMTEKSENMTNATKYMNEGMNMYAHSDDQKLGIISREDLENTYFGFSTVEGGVYTISFTNVEGREFEFVDLEANKAVKVAEGNTYTFTAAPNTVADYRFKLVGIKTVPTAVDNLNAAKNQTGIYTIMGQYVGEMNLWNTLPAGVYVVNGEKRVK